MYEDERTGYYVNVFAESKPHIEALNYTIYSVYTDSSRHHGKSNSDALLIWCRADFVANLTTGGVASRTCPECEVF